MTVQETLNLILQKQNELQAQFSALVVTLILFMVGMVTYLKDFKNHHTRIPNLGYQLVLKSVNKLKGKVRRMGGAPTIPDVAPVVMVAFCNDILRDLETVEPDKIKLTEGRWIVERHWHEIGGTSAEEYRKALQRLKSWRIAEQIGTKNTWVLSQPYRSLGSKLRGVIRHESPTPAAITAKTAQNMG